MSNLTAEIGKPPADCDVRMIYKIQGYMKEKEGGIPLTGNDLMLQMTMSFSGKYFALPMLVLNLGESASLGTGTQISTPLATDCFLNWPFAFQRRKQEERSRTVHVRTFLTKGHFQTGI